MLPRVFKQTFVAIVLLGLLWVPATTLAQAKFTNPLGSGANSLTVIINRIINFMLGLVGVLTLGALIWGGVLYIISLGKDDYIKQAKTIIFWALAGFVIVVLAFVILNTTGRFLGVGV